MVAPAGSIVTKLDGVLAVNKPAGWTSHDVVAKIRGLLGGARVGHAGTLDPAATGVLAVLVGRATRIAEHLLEWDKTYRAVLRLGEATDTQDATGTVVARHPVEAITDADIRHAVARFQGQITQMPPMYSAVKVAGVPLYRSARAGRTVEREPRAVTIHALSVDRIDGHDVTLTITCSKGTYIRTLCADIGAALGVGGHLLSLTRTRVGPLTIEQSLTLDDVASRVAAGTTDELLIPLDAVLSGLPAVTVDAAVARRVVHGVAVPHRSVVSPAFVRIKDADDRLIAIGRPQDGSVKIDRVLVDAETYQ